ncbi:polysaccharide deacetylase family sporulation protein PdaB [Bacillus sp. SM2101]|uniref:polysaccharide deacetylase family sporulation protein PdaB n=1 Tax=Bacillus sp. SM2101 TaxID=2805366 RepID=UPI001BDEC4DF
MNFFVVVNGRKGKQALIIIVAALFTAIFLYLENALNNTVFSTEDGPRAIYKGDERGEKIALTFDVNWGDEHILNILEVLKKEKLNATFFILADWAERHPEVVTQIAEDGHEIGSKGYSYKDYSELEASEIKTDILKSKDVFKVLQVKAAPLLRPPTGNINEEVIATASEVGYTVVHWSIDSQDWLRPGTKEITKNVTKNLNGGDIILLHASDSASQTAEALPSIIQFIKKKGYKNVTVTELITNTDTKSGEIN